MEEERKPALREFLDSTASCGVEQTSCSCKMGPIHSMNGRSSEQLVAWLGEVRLMNGQASPGLVPDWLIPVGRGA